MILPQTLGIVCGGMLVLGIVVALLFCGLVGIVIALTGDPRE